jgi:hypothetical protein
MILWTQQHGQSAQGFCDRFALPTISEGTMVVDQNNWNTASTTEAQAIYDQSVSHSQAQKPNSPQSSPSVMAIAQEKGHDEIARMQRLAMAYAANAIKQTSTMSATSATQQHHVPFGESSWATFKEAQQSPVGIRRSKRKER